MEKEIVNKWEENKDKLRKYYEDTPQKEYCGSYKDILKQVIRIVLNSEDSENYDNWKEDIHVIDDGDYQGTQIFLFHKDTYQPSEEDYIITSVGYGSCSGCDTLQAIHSYNDDERPTSSQVEDYMTLSLHLIQKMRYVESRNR